MVYVLFQEPAKSSKDKGKNGKDGEPGDEVRLYYRLSIACLTLVLSLAKIQPSTLIRTSIIEIHKDYQRFRLLRLTLLNHSHVKCAKKKEQLYGFFIRFS